jgi:hypothetical protein
MANGGFEDGMHGWTPLGGATLRITNSDVRHGRAAAYVATREPVPYGIVSAPTVGYPRRGDRYTVSAWVKAADRPKQIVIRLVEVGGDAEPRIAGATMARISRRWQLFSTAGRIQRADRSALQVNVTVEHSIGRGDGILIDDVQVRHMLRR